MRLATAPPQHLSNHEVLAHFLALKSENDTLRSRVLTRSARAAAEAQKRYPLEDDDPDLDVDFGEESVEEDVAVRREVSEQLVWVQDQVIHYLCSEYNSTARQTDEGVARLADELQDHDLTKGEVLQICNLAPTLPVELYCIVEEVDSRFHPNPEARLDAIVNQVQSTLLQSIPPQLERFTTSATPSQQDQLEDVEPSSRGVRATQGIGEVQEFVHEAMWGAAREEGVGQEDVDAD
ncbi:MAG: hypothetical protein TREMPRED_002112 [Tremellales sp. Tagirdzhanova-0007]|nr:MAG: hypothetical protein TREMPRED_002112 [Tremellales sp. Tagirdzhanova-0007]